MSKTATTSISFNVSKSINIGNFEAVKINYGESITVDPQINLHEQRDKLIEDCYAVIKKETAIWEGLKAVQHVGRDKKTNVVKAKSFTSFKDQQEH